MAVAILGGLVTSTLVGLFVLPVLYARFGVVAAPRRPEPDDATAPPWAGDGPVPKPDAVPAAVAGAPAERQR
jgi:hypothetical protein